MLQQVDLEELRKETQGEVQKVNRQQTERKKTITKTNKQEDSVVCAQLTQVSSISHMYICETTITFGIPGNAI